MKLLDEKGLTTVWAAIKNTFTSKSDADGKYAKKADLNPATSTSAGVMTAADKKKLDGIDANIGKFNSVNSIEDCVCGRINFINPWDTEINLDSILHKEDIIIFAYLQDQSNITCSESFIYNGDPVDQKVVAAGTFLITCSSDVISVLPF